MVGRRAARFTAGTTRLAFAVRLFVLALLATRAPPAAADPTSRAEDPSYEPPAPAPSDESADLPWLEGEGLTKQVPDLVDESWPPRPRLIIRIGSAYPFQLSGLGLGLQMYLGELFRVNLLYSGGVNTIQTPTKNVISYSSYAEAIFGVRLFAIDGTLRATVTPPGGGVFSRAPKPTPLFRARIPAKHTLLLEFGMLGGNIALLQCSAPCTPPVAGFPDDRIYVAKNPAFFYPLAGLRYVMSSVVSSKAQPLIDRRWLAEVTVDVLLRPLGASTDDLLRDDLSPVTTTAVGALVGATIPFCSGCWPMNLSVGYLPEPTSVLFSVGVGG